jgi:magnesium transporter
VLKAICYAEDSGWSEVNDLTKISDLVGDGTHLVWAYADVANIDPADLDTIQEEFGLHPLAVEDATSLRQRPKLEAYENHLFAVMHQLDDVADQLEASQISCFIGGRWILTIHEHAQRTVDETLKRLRKAPKPTDRGPSYIMHAILDAMVDDYQHIGDEIEADVETLEDHLLKDPAAPVERQLYSMKQRLARLRRYAVPGERILATMLGPAGTIPDETSAFFRDIHDHLLRIIDQMRNVQDLVDALLDLRRIEQANSLNEVTKRLTGWAAIIAVPTFIASVYGMNFELLPNEGDIFGFFFAVALMSGSGTFLYRYFKKKNWL